MLNRGKEFFRHFKSNHQYRIPSNRKADHDYASPGWYLVTICVQDRIPAFAIPTHVKTWGEYLAELPEEVIPLWDLWYGLVKYYPGCSFKAFVVMPDHIHGIVELAEGNTTQLGVIVHAFKKHSGIYLRGHFPNFKWQARYHDRIIHDERELAYAIDYLSRTP